MGFSCGLVGLPNAGKTTIFNALTDASAEVANYPFTTIEPNISVVPVPDERLQRLSAIFLQQNVIPAAIKFVDIAGLVKGASRGEGLGNQFLSHIRDVDAIGFIIRCFEERDVSHIFGNIDPARDVEILTLELGIKDIETVENRLKKALTSAKSGEKRFIEEVHIIENLKAYLSGGKPARGIKKATNIDPLLKDMRLLTDKPAIYIANVDENDLGTKKYSESLRKISNSNGAPFVIIPGKLEKELMEMKGEERKDIMDAYGIRELGILNLIRAGYKILNLITFYTAVGRELRAWSLQKGTRAKEAAGRIHSDMEKGFIKAEVINFLQLDQIGSESKAREMGAIKAEGKDYEIQDGDVVRFLFKG